MVKCVGTSEIGKAAAQNKNYTLQVSLIKQKMLFDKC